MKRCISIFLVLSLTLACLIAPAAAVDVDDYGVIDLMSYGYFDAFAYDDSIYVNGHRIDCWSPTPSFSIQLLNPGISVINSYSMLVATDANWVEVGMGMSTISPTPFDGVYLVQGDYAEFYTQNDFMIIDIAMDGTYIEFINFLITPNFVSVAPVGVACWNLSTNGYFETEPDGYLDNEFYLDGGNSMAESVRFQFCPVAEDGSYEYFDLHLGFSGVYIESISVLQGDKSLDYVVTSSYYDGNGTLVTKSGNGLNDALTETVSEFWISIKVYCPDAALIDGTPYVFIDLGSHNGQQSINYNMTIFPAYVSISGSEPNPVLVWFTRLFNSLSSWFGSIFDWFEQVYLALLDGVSVEDDGSGAEFDSESNDLQDQFDSIGDAMSGMEKPDISEDDIDPGIIVPSDDVVYATSPLTAVMNNGIIKDVFMLALIFIFAGYIIYGKR